VFGDLPEGRIDFACLAQLIPALAAFMIPSYWRSMDFPDHIIALIFPPDRLRRRLKNSGARADYWYAGGINAPHLGITFQL